MCISSPRYLSLLAGLLLLAGCQPSNEPMTLVRGKVLYKGAPAAGAFVFLIRQGDSPLEEKSVMAVVQEDGSFTMVCDAKGKGAPPGTYAVLIQWPDADRTKSLAHKDPDRLLGRYADPKNPGWHVEIKTQANELSAFELTDAGPLRKE